MYDVICVMAIITTVAIPSATFGDAITHTPIIATASRQDAMSWHDHYPTSLPPLPSSRQTPSRHASARFTVGLRTSYNNRNRPSPHYRCFTFYRSLSLPVRIEILPRHVQHRSVAHTPGSCAASALSAGQLMRIQDADPSSRAVLDRCFSLAKTRVNTVNLF
jgi:hypothetical protein